MMESCPSRKGDVHSVKSSLGQTRSVLRHFFDSSRYHLIIICLVVLDVLIVFGELVLDLEILRSNECRKDEDCPRLRLANASDLHSQCTFNPLSTKCLYLDGKHRCTTEDKHADINPEHVLHDIGLVVLGIFIVEVSVKFVVLGKEFFKNKLEVIDGTIVIISFILDLTIGQEHHMDSVSILIVLRLWRFARIFNGITVVIQNQHHHHAKHKAKMNCRRCQAEKEAEAMKETISQLNDELQKERKHANTLQHENDIISAQLESLRQPVTTLVGTSFVKSQKFGKIVDRNDLKAADWASVSWKDAPLSFIGPRLDSQLSFV